MSYKSPFLFYSAFFLSLISVYAIFAGFVSSSWINLIHYKILLDIIICLDISKFIPLNCFRGGFCKMLLYSLSQPFFLILCLSCLNVFSWVLQELFSLPLYHFHLLCYPFPSYVEGVYSDA